MSEYGHNDSSAYLRESEQMFGYTSGFFQLFFMVSGKFFFFVFLLDG